MIIMRDKLLFTPGPLTTSASVKRAMLRDLGSREPAFIDVVRGVRQGLLALAGVGPEFTAVPVQGSGTFGLEAMLGTVLPPEGRLLVAANGAYGARLHRMAQVLRIPVQLLASPEHLPLEPRAVARALAAQSGITHVAVVHNETTAGVVNPVREIGRVVAEHGSLLLVDGMSSFGAIPLDLEEAGVAFLVSSANKCIEGVPGFAFVLARRSALRACRGQARSLSLDLVAQDDELEASGQFRFTPPTHALLAFACALRELQDEGGVEGRAARYAANHRTLIEGMEALGLRPLVAPQHRSHVITTFHYPEDPRFRFEDFYDRLADRGFIIYPGKLTQTDCFRVGTAGRIFPSDVAALVVAAGEVLREMLLPVPLSERGRRLLSEGGAP